MVPNGQRRRHPCLTHNFVRLVTFAEVIIKDSKSVQGCRQVINGAFTRSGLNVPLIATQTLRELGRLSVCSFFSFSPKLWVRALESDRRAPKGTEASKRCLCVHPSSHGPYSYSLIMVLGSNNYLHQPKYSFYESKQVTVQVTSTRRSARFLVINRTVGTAPYGYLGSSRSSFVSNGVLTSTTASEGCLLSEGRSR